MRLSCGVCRLTAVRSGSGEGVNKMSTERLGRYVRPRRDEESRPMVGNGGVFLYASTGEGRVRLQQPEEGQPERRRGEAVKVHGVGRGRLHGSDVRADYDLQDKRGTYWTYQPDRKRRKRGVSMFGKALRSPGLRRPRYEQRSWHDRGTREQPTLGLLGRVRCDGALGRRPAYTMATGNHVTSVPLPGLQSGREAFRPR